MADCKYTKHHWIQLKKKTKQNTQAQPQDFRGTKNLGRDPLCHKNMMNVFMTLPKVWRE